MKFFGKILKTRKWRPSISTDSKQLNSTAHKSLKHGKKSTKVALSVLIFSPTTFLKREEKTFMSQKNSHFSTLN